MKILFVTPSYKPAYIYGGPAVSVSELAETLTAIGHLVTVYTTTANGKSELNVQTGTAVDVKGVKVYYFKRQTGDHTHISFALWKKLYDSAARFDVIHLQSWWSILIMGAAAVCLAKKCRYIISPRGMLSRYSFKQQHSLPKKLIHKTSGNRLLKHSVLHATTQLEWDDCRSINPSWSGFVLPNIVRFPKSIDLSAKAIHEADTPLIFGFLSRIDHKKGLELLFTALSDVYFPFILKIAGSGDENYIAELKSLAVRLKIDDKLVWCGWINGDDKFTFLESVDVFTLTSYNENFANTVIESLVVGTPVLVSQGVGLADYVTKQKIGWTCETEVRSITSAINDIFHHKAKLSSMSLMASERVRIDFHNIHLGYQYINAYEQFANGDNVKTSVGKFA